MNIFKCKIEKTFQYKEQMLRFLIFINMTLFCFLELMIHVDIHVIKDRTVCLNTKHVNYKFKCGIPLGVVYKFDLWSFFWPLSFEIFTLLTLATHFESINKILHEIVGILVFFHSGCVSLLQDLLLSLKSPQNTRSTRPVFHRTQNIKQPCHKTL